MTTILATRDRMGSDTFVSDGTRGAKIYRGQGFLVGEACSEANYSLRLVNWVLDGQRGPVPDPFPNSDHDGSVLVLRKTGLSMIDWRGVELPMDNDFFAIGSGGEFAIGAMAAGATMEEALEIAARYDGGTKAPYHFAELRSAQRRRKA